MESYPLLLVLVHLRRQEGWGEVINSTSLWNVGKICLFALPFVSKLALFFVVVPREHSFQR